MAVFFCEMSFPQHSSLALYLVIKAVILLVEVILMEEICWQTTWKIQSSGLLKVSTAHLTLANTQFLGWEIEVTYFEKQRARTTTQTNGYIGETKKLNYSLNCFSVHKGHPSYSTFGHATS